MITIFKVRTAYGQSSSYFLKGYTGMLCASFQYTFKCILNNLMKGLMSIKNEKSFKERLARNITGSLSSIPNIQTDNYAVYADVQINCIRLFGDKNKSPLSMCDIQNGIGNVTLDLVICNEDNIVFCIMIDSNNNKIEQLFDTTLRGIRHISISSNEFSKQKFDLLSNHVKTVIQLYELNPNRCPLRYTLSGISNFLTGGDDNYSELISKHIVDSKSNITEFGKACGLIYKYILNNDLLMGKVDRAPVVIDSSLFNMKIEKFLGISSVEGKMPLKMRIDRLIKALPSDDIYAELTVNALKEFINTPLEFFCQTRCEEYELLRNDLKEICTLIKSAKARVHQRRKLSTYKDLLDFIYSIKNEEPCFAEKENQDRFNNLFEKIILDTANLIAPDTSVPFICEQTVQKTHSGIISLKERTKYLKSSGNGRFSILNMPLKHYYYAASLIMQSNYPNWVYREKVLKHIIIRNATELNYSMITVLYNAYISNKNLEMTDEDFYSLLYNLIIAPIANLQYDNNYQKNIIIEKEEENE